MDDNYQNEDYRNESYHHDEYQNDTVSEKSSHNTEMDSASEQWKIEPVILDQDYENATELEYESVPYSGVRMRTREEGLKTETAPIVLMDEKEGRAFGKKHFIIFCVVIFCSLIMVMAALVMASLKCFSQCPSGWLKVQKSCYFSSTEGKTWEEGRRICQSLGADLIVIEDEKEQDFLMYKMHSKQDVFWIGLRYTMQNQWKWVDGTNGSYQNWKTSEPTETTDRSLKGKHCVISSRSNWWKNIHCKYVRSYICEKDRHVTCVLQSPQLPY